MGRDVLCSYSPYCRVGWRCLIPVESVMQEEGGISKAICHLP